MPGAHRGRRLAGWWHAEPAGLPGNWESTRFHLPRDLCERLPHIGDGRTQVCLHNDAVVQGLSEMPFMQDVERWAVLTVGTGLGNASYTNRQSPEFE